MSIKWDKLKADSISAVTSFFFVIFSIPGILLYICIFPVLGPIAGIIYFFQRDYTDKEVNDYVKIYFAIAGIIGMLILIDEGDRP